MFLEHTLTLAKISKNRAILRKIDAHIARHGMYVAITFVAVFITVVTTGGLYRQAAVVCICFGAIFALMCALAIHSFLRFDYFYGKGPNAWRKRYIVFHCGFKAVWGILAAFMVLLLGLTTPTFMVILISIAVGALDNVEWSPYHRQNAIAKSLLYTPLIGSLLYIQDMEAFMVAAMVMVVYTLLLSQSKLLNKRHWQAEQNRFNLQVQTSDLSHAVKSAESADQFKAEFLANVTHEIRTPMNSVLGMLALLDDTHLNSQQKQLQQVAVTSGESLLSLLDEVRDYSRVVSGTIPFNNSVISLRRCLNQTLDLLGPFAHSKGVELSVIYEPGIPVRIKTDSERVAQIINNLVVQAISATKGKELLLRVSMVKEAEDVGTLRVDIVDNESCFMDAEIEALHLEFNKVSIRSMSDKERSGLGVAIARGLAESQNGGIGFRAASSGVGALYWSYLQVGISTQQAQVDLTVKPLIDERVLVVGAYPGMQEAIESELRTLDINVVAVEDLDRALQEAANARAEDRSYSVAIINCPIRSAIDFEAVQENLRLLDTLDMKAVMLASLTQRTELHTRHFNSGNVEWLTKPLTRVGLSNTLHKLYGSTPATTVTASDHKGATGDESARILLVEDNKVNQMVARNMLNKLGYVVTVANHGKEALSYLHDRRFDLVLMDCVMPEMDGYETTSRIRGYEEGTENHIPIVAMTACVVDGEKSRCLIAGMDDFLSKPVNIDELGAKIRLWLGEQGSSETLAATLQSPAQTSHNTDPDRRHA